MSTSLSALQDAAAQLRIDSVTSTTAAGSGHPTTCLSAADIMATLFFDEMRFDAKNPRDPDNDRFILSKGHAAPVLYAAWAAAGLFPRAELLKLRQIDSDLEGHPTPRLSFVDVATGSLGQGICAAIGTALNARRIGSEYRTYVVCGDGEMAEGSVWEAADVALCYKLDNLCGIIDVNGLGQSQHTQFGHEMDQIAARWTAFGWHTMVVDGHDIPALQKAFAEARATKGRPSMVLARTLKGKGLAAIEGKSGWHGKALKKGEEADAAVAELQKRMTGEAGKLDLKIAGPRSKSRPDARPDYSKMPAPAYALGDSIATREAWGAGLAAVGKFDTRVVALDADVKNSTFSDKFEKIAPDRFFQNFIAEQVMVGAAMGFAARGAIPFPSTFACFLARASDFVRMGGVSFSNVKYSGSHCGVSIGEDGPSQMALEDLAMMRCVPGCAVLYPCDGMSTERLVVEMTRREGMAYMRTSRPKTPVIYGPDETFPIGGSKVLRQSDSDAAAVIGAGVTVFEALKAYDQLKAEGINIRVIDAYSVQPIDAKTMLEAARATRGNLITVEDHYATGGIGDAVSEAVAEGGFAVRRLAVREVPRSGQPDELIDRYGISARHIVDAVRRGAAGKR
ncbi:MAG: transketolase [Acidobacteriota bacterium]|nr:transketolase [Acidobacteriota bacterium]